MNVVSMDFGTYNSAIAYRLPNGGIEMFKPPRSASPIIPSFLKFSADGEFDCFGEPAKNAIASDSAHVVWGLKRLLGLSSSDAHRLGELSRFHYKIIDESGKLLIEVGDRLYTPIDLVRLFLAKTRESCESPLSNLPLAGALDTLIVTHPAYFESGQTTSLKEAAHGAGYQTVELIREPEAAAIAYKDLIDFSKEPLVMVIDWGAGTLDFFIAHFFLEGSRPKIAPDTPAFGDTRLGGIDMDDALLRRTKDINNINELKDNDEARLRVEIEMAKIALSTTGFITRFFACEGIQFPLNFARSSQNVSNNQASAPWVFLEETLSDPSYERDKHKGGILGKFKDNLRFTLKKHDLTPCDIDQVILVGGPMCMPCVRAAIGEVFAHNPAVIEQLARFGTGFPISPFEAVVKGAIMSDDVDMGAFISPYTYGFLLDDKLLAPLVIPCGTPIAKGTQKVVKEITPLNAPAGKVLNISLYMKIETAAGIEHLKLGDYPFAPLSHASRGTSIQPSIELSDEGICSLKMSDRISGKPPLALFITDEPEEKIGEPEIHDLEIPLIDGPALQDLMDMRKKGDFSVADVDRERNKALMHQKMVQQAKNQGSQLPDEALRCHQVLNNLLPVVSPGKPIKADSQEAIVFQEMINNSDKLINIMRNAKLKF